MGTPFDQPTSALGPEMADGVICEEGTPEELFLHPKKQETRDFLSRFRQS